jgi:hypothetical protein
LRTLINLTFRLNGTFSGDPAALFAELVENPLGESAHVHSTEGDLLCVLELLFFREQRPDYGATYERNVRSAADGRSRRRSAGRARRL